MRIRSVLVPFLALLPLLLLNGPASGQGYVPNPGTLVLSTNETRPGGTVTVSGSGCLPNSTVTIELRPAPVAVVGTTQADQNGNFSTTVTIPADATPGAHTIVAICPGPGGQQREMVSAVTVLSDVLIRGPLPRTGGATTIPVGIAGVVLIGVGTLAVLAARRKRTVS